MGFKEVSSLDADVTVALGKINKKTGKPYPKDAEGYYLGSRKVQNKRGESSIHFLQTEKGNLGVWGTTDLDRKVGQVPAGAMIRITSTGTKPTPNGDMYTYKVEVDADNTIEVSAAIADAPSYADSDNDTAYSDEDDEVEEDDAPAVVAALTAAERKAKVEAMIKNRNAKN